MIDSLAMVQKLDGVREGAPVFVSYIAGREPTERAIREAARARREGYAKRHFFGKVHRVWNTKNGDPVLTILCDTRDCESTGKPEAYRTFNPRLGELLCLEIL